MEIAKKKKEQAFYDNQYKSKILVMEEQLLFGGSLFIDALEQLCRHQLKNHQSKLSSKADRRNHPSPPQGYICCTTISGISFLGKALFCSIIM